MDDQPQTTAPPEDERLGDEAPAEIVSDRMKPDPVVSDEASQPSWWNLMTARWKAAGVIPARPSMLTLEQIAGRLDSSTDEATDLAHETARKLMESEEARQQIVERKATAFMGTFGLSVTLVFGLGALLLEKLSPGDVSALGVTKTVVAMAYALLIGVGAVSVICAWVALLVRRRPGLVNEEAVFDAAALKKDKVGYQRFLCLHYCQVYRENQKVTDRRAQWVKGAQVTFFIFVISVFLATVALAFVAAHR